MQRLDLSCWIQRRSIVLWQLSLCQWNATLNQGSPGRLRSALTGQPPPLWHPPCRRSERRSVSQMEEDKWTCIIDMNITVLIVWIQLSLEEEIYFFLLFEKPHTFYFCCMYNRAASFAVKSILKGQTTGQSPQEDTLSWSSPVAPFIFDKALSGQWLHFKSLLPVFCSFLNSASISHTSFFFLAIPASVFCLFVFSGILYDHTLILLASDWSACLPAKPECYAGTIRNQAESMAFKSLSCCGPPTWVREYLDNIQCNPL